MTDFERRASELLERPDVIGEGHIINRAMSSHVAHGVWLMMCGRFEILDRGRSKSGALETYDLDEVGDPRFPGPMCKRCMEAAGL